MSINEALGFFENLLTETDNKREIKVHKSFIAILTDLINRNLTEEQLFSIGNELDSLKLNANPENKKRYFSKKLTAFKKYLKDELSLISEGYYTAIGMSLGMSFGVAIGASFGESTGIALGISFGMIIGLVIGKTKDVEAEKQGRVLKTKFEL